jgi:very-short-patch-repair endonuclease
MPKRGIVTGQRISPELYARTKELRQKMTPAEMLLWQGLRAGRLQGFHFRRQQVIGRFIVDFYCHKADLVVEVDGGVHKDQQAYDREHEFFLQDIGLKVLRFANTEVEHNLEAVLDVILVTCQQSQQSDIGNQETGCSQQGDELVGQQVNKSIGQ